MRNMVLRGNRAGGLQIAADQGNHFNAADLLDCIQVLLAECAGAGENYLH
jgi:hypothetical protein